MLSSLLISKRENVQVSGRSRKWGGVWGGAGLVVADIQSESVKT